jgi:hypothetical protein
MKHKELFSLLDSVQENQEETILKKHDRVLILDGLNLFFRNFAIMNMVNPDGIHIGGLGGFFRSLGAMIRQTNPTSVYVVFDGAGSTTNRKNLLSEYKGTRNLQRITNWEAFDNIEEEHDSKIDQIVRIIQYLKLLPVKTTILDKVEADDIIAVLAEKLVEKHNSTFGTGLDLYDVTSTWYISTTRQSNVDFGSLRIYNRGLTDSEILQNYNARKNIYI